MSKELGDRLKALRLAQGWSLRKAAQQIGGISYNRLRDFERGEDPHSGIPTLPSELHLGHMARAYKVDLDELLVMAGYGVQGPVDTWELKLLERVRGLAIPERDQLLQRLAELEEAYRDRPNGG